MVGREFEGEAMSKQAPQDVEVRSVSYTFDVDKQDLKRILSFIRTMLERRVGKRIILTMKTIKN